MIEKRWKSTDRSYKDSQQKNAKSFAKGLDKAETHLIIFSDKRQATSGIKTRSAQTNSQLNTNFLTVNRTHKSESPSLCVFYIIHSIKPQRPQRAQRMIKEAITKTPLKTFAKLSFAQRFACSAVKLKSIRRLVC